MQGDVACSLRGYVLHGLRFLSLLMGARRKRLLFFGACVENPHDMAKLRPVSRSLNA